MAVRLPLLSNRQVPQEVFNYAPLTASAVFGFELGLGFRTNVTSAVPFVAVAVLLLGAMSPAEAVLVALGFAAGRFAMPALRIISGRGSAWDERLRRALRWVNRSAAAIAVIGALVITAG